MIREMLQDVAEPPTVLALDKLWTGTKAGCLTLLCAPGERWALDLFPGRTQATAEALLSAPGEEVKVEAVVMDMT